MISWRAFQRERRTAHGAWGTARRKVTRSGHLGAALLRTTVGRPASPLKLNLCLTYWCQYRCKTCNIWQRKPTDELTTDEVIAPRPRESRHHLGGSHRRRDLPAAGHRRDPRRRRDRLAAARAAALSHQRLPHRSHRRERRADRRHAGRRRPIVTVSLDGDEALNDEIRGIKGGFRRQIETFNALRRIPGSRPCSGMTLSAYNVGRFARDVRGVRARVPGAHASTTFTSTSRRSRATTTATADRAACVRIPRRSGESCASTGGCEDVPRSPAQLLENAYLGYLDGSCGPGGRRCRATRCAPAASSIRGASSIPASPTTRPIGRLRETGMRLEPDLECARDRGSCRARSGRGSARSAGPRARRTRAFSATCWPAAAAATAPAALLEPADRADRTGACAMNVTCFTDATMQAHLDTAVAHHVTTDVSAVIAAKQEAPSIGDVDRRTRRYAGDDHRRRRSVDRRDGRGRGRAAARA